MKKQYKWQLEKIKQAKCVKCGKKAVTKLHCAKHRKIQNEAHMKWYRKKGHKIKTVSITLTDRQARSLKILSKYFNKPQSTIVRNAYVGYMSRCHAIIKRGQNDTQ